MPETVQQYIARLGGLVGDQDPWSVLADTPGRLRSLIASATPRELRWTSAPTRWSIAIILAHLADAEVVGAWRFRSLLTRDGIELQAYDQNAWAAAFHYEQAEPADSLDLFEALRRSTLRTLRATDPERLQHAGMHQERGRESIEHLLRMYAGHDLNHLGQIERLLSEARGDRG
jgi:DinB family protein